MSTSIKTKNKMRRAFVPNSATAKSVIFDETMMNVYLNDGRIVSVPLIWFPILHAASSEQRLNYEIGMGGLSIHWSEIDEDISVANLLAGADWQST